MRIFFSWQSKSDQVTSPCHQSLDPCLKEKALSFRPNSKTAVTLHWQRWNLLMVHAIPYIPTHHFGLFTQGLGILKQL